MKRHGCRSSIHVERSYVVSKRIGAEVSDREIASRAAGQKRGVITNVFRYTLRAAQGVIIGLVVARGSLAILHVSADRPHQILNKDVLLQHLGHRRRGAEYLLPGNYTRNAHYREFMHFGGCHRNWRWDGPNRHSHRLSCKPATPVRRCRSATVGCGSCATHRVEGVGRFIEHYGRGRRSPNKQRSRPPHRTRGAQTTSVLAVDEGNRVLDLRYKSAFRSIRSRNKRRPPRSKRLDVYIS